MIEIKSKCFPVTLKSAVVAVVCFSADIPSHAIIRFGEISAGISIFDTIEAIPSWPPSSLR